MFVKAWKLSHEAGSGMVVVRYDMRDVGYLLERDAVVTFPENANKKLLVWDAKRAESGPGSVGSAAGALASAAMLKKRLGASSEPAPPTAPPAAAAPKASVPRAEAPSSSSMPSSSSSAASVTSARSAKAREDFERLGAAYVPDHKPASLQSEVVVPPEEEELAPEPSMQAPTGEKHRRKSKHKKKHHSDSPEPWAGPDANDPLVA